MRTPKYRANDMRTTVDKLISESEALLAAIGEDGAQRYRDTADALQRQIQRARNHVDDLQYATVRRARLAARQADHYVQENPWKTVGAAVALGAVAGAFIALLIARAANEEFGSRDDSR